MKVQQKKKMRKRKCCAVVGLWISEILFLSSVFSPDRSSANSHQMPSSLPPSGQTCEPGSAVAAAAAVASGRTSWSLPHSAGQTSDPPIASGPSLSSREQELREEEQLLLAKIHQLTGDASPRPHSMKRLVPDPFEILSDDTQPLISSAHVWEKPLTTATEPPANHMGRLTTVEAKV